MGKLDKNGCLLDGRHRQRQSKLKSMKDELVHKGKTKTYKSIVNVNFNCESHTFTFARKQELQKKKTNKNTPTKNNMVC